MRMVGVKTIAEAETFLFKSKYFQLFIVEIAVQLLTYAIETMQLQIIPDRLYEMDKPYVVEMVFDDGLQIFVDGEKRHCILVGQNLLKYCISLHPAASMMIDGLFFALVEF